MFDADGKIPSGTLSSILDGCDLSKMISDSLCGEQPYDFLKKLIKIPYGNTVSVGAIEECLKATEDKSTSLFASRFKNNNS